MILVFRALVLFVAAGALAVALAIALRHEHVPVADVARRYVCPMHPEVTSAAPGECPICRMDLEAIGAGASGIHAATVGASTFQVYDDVRRRGFAPHLRAPASVEGNGFVSALLYDDEIATLTPHQGSVFFLAAAPAVSLPVRFSSEPPVRWDAATSRVRFRMEAEAPALAEGTVGWIKLQGQRLVRLTIPYSAVLEGTDGAYVLVASPDGRTLGKRSIEIGRTTGGIAIVVSGVRDHERVLVRNAFFVDAERRLRREATMELGP